MLTRLATSLLCCKRKFKKTKLNKVIIKNKKNDITYLKKISYSDTLPFIPLIEYGKVIKVYDGDTITVASKLPFDDSPIYRFSVRLAGIDSPEIKGQSLTEINLAIKSRDALHKLIYGKVVEIRNHRKEKYGRLLADIYFNDIHVNQWMINNNLAVIYNGGKKNRPDHWDM